MRVRGPRVDLTEVSVHFTRALALSAALALAGPRLRAQDTFSLVAADPATGELVSAGASCLDGNRAAGGARVVSTVIPGVGALHTQSYYSAANQANGRALLMARLAAKPLLDSLVSADVGGLPAFRQYAAVTFDAGRPRLAAYTGTSCAPYAAHYLGQRVAIAGNILLDSLVIARMREAYLAAEAAGRPLADRAVAALLAVAYPGADRRCLSAGLSSRSAFVRLARPGDDATALTLDLVVEFPEGGADPIDLLAERYATWVRGGRSPN